MKTRSPKDALDEGLPVKAWFVLPQANELARRHEIWTLLGWYHEKVVAPQLGFRGAFRRLWWQLSGQWERLLSPWQQIHREVAFRRAQRQREREIAIARGDAGPADHDNRANGRPILEDVR